MTHRAETIMQAVTTTLTGLTTTGTRIQRGRVRTVETAPALSIMMGSDGINPDRSAYPHVARDLTINVIIHVMNNTAPETELNTIRAEVFAALMADRTLGQTFVSDIDAIGDDDPELDGEGEKITARQQMNFIVKYRHNWSSAEA